MIIHLFDKAFDIVEAARKPIEFTTAVWPEMVADIPACKRQRAYRALRGMVSRAAKSSHVPEGLILSVSNTLKWYA